VTFGYDVPLLVAYMHRNDHPSRSRRLRVARYCKSTFFSVYPDFDILCANGHCSSFLMCRELIFHIHIVHQYRCIISKGHFDSSSQLIHEGCNISYSNLLTTLYWSTSEQLSGQYTIGVSRNSKLCFLWCQAVTPVVFL
jgi:L-ribulose-5-phosphate 3-epimerase UlaE